MLKDNAGTQKQVDDVTGQIDVIKQQIRSVETQNYPVVDELKSIDIQILQIEDQHHLIGDLYKLPRYYGRILESVFCFEV